MRKTVRVVAFVLLVVCIFCFSFRMLPERAPLQLYFFDVGQGDAMLLRTHSGDVLIDAGSEQSEALLSLRLEQLGVTELKLAIFTHFDEDHMGGADAILRSFPTQEIWISNVQTETEASKRMFAAANACGVQPTCVSAGEFFDLEDLRLLVYHPIHKYPMEGNEASLIVRLSFGNISALFMGDAGTEQEELLIQGNTKENLRTDLCKLGHHGSNTSSSADFLTCIEPRYAVISCAAVNLYGHPSGLVLDRLETNGIETFCTAWQGEILFESDGEKLYPVIN